MYTVLFKGFKHSFRFLKMDTVNLPGLAANLQFDPLPAMWEKAPKPVECNGWAIMLTDEMLGEKLQVCFIIAL